MNVESLTYKSKILAETQLTDIVECEGVYIVVGNNGFIARTENINNPDSWEEINHPQKGTGRGLHCIIYDGIPKRLVVVGQHRTIMISDNLDKDFISKIANDSTNNRTIYSIIYHSQSNRFLTNYSDLVTPWQMAYITSTNNGDSWTLSSFVYNYATGQMGYGYDVIYFNSVFISASYGDSTSSNGNRNGGIRTSSTFSSDSWTSRFGTTNILGLAYNHKIAVAVGRNGTITTSTNGIS